MSPKYKTFSLLLAAVFIAACTHHDMPDIEDLNQRLETNISADGTKQFNYLIERIREPDMEGCHSRQRFDNGRKKYKNPAERNRDLKEFAHTLLREKMSSEGYCTTGYRLYEEVLSQNNYKARGECREGANDNPLADKAE